MNALHCITDMFIVCTGVPTIDETDYANGYQPFSGTCGAFALNGTTPCTGECRTSGEAKSMCNTEIGKWKPPTGCAKPVGIYYSLCVRVLPIVVSSSSQDFKI